MPRVSPNQLGELESVVLEILWNASEALSVRDVLSRVKRKPALAYTTVLTVLDRLYAKQVVQREKDGKAYLYRPSVSRETWFGEQAARALVAREARGREGVLLAFLESTERSDPELLDRLSALIADRRRGRAK